MEEFSFAQNPVEVTPVETPFRRIQTPIPVPESIDILNRINAYESRSMHGQMPIVWDRAKDFQVFDRWGNCWIDFTSTIFVANAGHANKRITDALRKAVDQDLLHTYTYGHEARADYLEKLIEVTPEPFEKAYLVSAGTEATEMVLKLIRLQARKAGKRRPGVVAFDGSYHGRTMGAAQVSGLAPSREWMGYNDPNIFRLQFPFEWGPKYAPVNESGRERFERDVERLLQQGVDLKTDIAGVMFESYVGWAAAFFPKDYVQAWADLARQNDFLIAFDEIQAGWGRTGRLFAYEHYDVTPDLISCGKGLSSSLPLAAVLGRAEILDLPDVGSMSSTHSANPLCCAAGLANIQAFQELDLVAEAARKGDILKSRMDKLREKHADRIPLTLCRGMVSAVHICDPETREPDGRAASLICEAALRKGLLLVHTGRETIKLGPPLTIPDDALMEGMDVLEEAMDEVFMGRHD
jgi:4-aminobutyrate aminotransferase-like enzyme